LRLLAIDHTTLTLPESGPLWKRFRSHRGKKGLGPVAVELACIFHLASCAPVAYTLGRAATSDHQLITRLIGRLRRRDLVLIDNGFYYLKTFLKIRQRRAHFLIPAKRSHRPRVLRQLGPSDYLCRIQSADQTLTVRVLYLQRPGFRRRRLITSLLDPDAFPAAEFSDLYHRRWQVETFFRDFKHTLKVTHWHCRHPKSFEQELLVHLLAVCLMRRVMLQAASHASLQVHRLSFARCLTHLRLFFRRLLAPGARFQSLLARLIRACAQLRIRVQPGRTFPRDRQHYRKKARGLLRKRRGRKPTPSSQSCSFLQEVRPDQYLLA
jgi:hypothetical protein